MMRYKDFQYLLKNHLGSLYVSMSINKLGIKIKLYLILLKIYCTFDPRLSYWHTLSGLENCWH